MLLLAMILLLTANTVALQLQAAVSDSAKIIGKPNCTTQCGEVSIPYPFGIGDPERCYFDEWYEIECRNSTENYTPFLRLTNMEVLEISTSEGTLAVKNPIRFSNCKGKDYGREAANLTGSPFVYSQRRNRFTAVSCGNLALMNFETKVDYSRESRKQTVHAAACMSLCEKKTTNHSCNGMNCCQTTIPSDLVAFTTTFDTTYFYGDSVSCSYAFLVDQEWFESRSMRYDHIFSEMDSVPVVLEWSLLYSDSEVEVSGKFLDEMDKSKRLNSTSYCKIDNITSSIFNYTRIQCHCENGFEGNPYLLLHGCQDVNECENPPDECKDHTCLNLHGSYMCKKKNPTIKRVLLDVGKVVLYMADKNECENPPDDCEDHLSESAGGYVCHKKERKPNNQERASECESWINGQNIGKLMQKRDLYQGCFLNEWFEIIYQNHNSSNTIPKPILNRTKLEVIEISVEGTLQQISESTNSEGSPFKYSQNNKFIAVGCGAIALMNSGEASIGGCSSICNNTTYVNDLCKGFSAHACLHEVSKETRIFLKDVKILIIARKILIIVAKAIFVLTILDVLVDFNWSCKRSWSIVSTRIHELEKAAGTNDVPKHFEEVQDFINGLETDEKYHQSHHQLVILVVKHTCGNVSIPYPFGIGDSRCYFDEWYQTEYINISMNKLEDIPFLKKNKLEVVEISASQGKLRVKHPIRFLNYPGKQSREAESCFYSYNRRIITTGWSRVNMPSW
ncbi:hypothetical protein FEM48_Zijuj04G0154400 [Ziziphus jujuba var. spinosa]|uniref:Uncharacterized protein n=1 Tax=Ziziphus jujuba var. spinosa TaxID=714518 RepID=A0A978VKN3_ZIZJJ|nr:hypothetical protein FEM48_Zijuj04G0154400 [Ziziphus jujuba var. spinosa]